MLEALADWGSDARLVCYPRHVQDLTYALAEEIGDPDLFVGREQEMARLLKWAEATKLRRSKSMAILARRKKGKTALLQRFFNILYTRGDPQLIPFYYRIPESLQTKLDFTEMFYRRTLTQYFAFTTRTPKWVGAVLPMAALKDLAAADQDLTDDILAMEDMMARAPTASWPYAQETAHRISQVKDVRILQILDEFQYMNKYIIGDDSRQVELLCHSYMGAAESKFSPQIVAGSYIGWLGAILRHLTARYRDWRLESLSDAEALEAVYNYAYTFQVAITDDTAPYIARVCDKDPFYIAATITNDSEAKDLTTEQGVRDALTYETITGKGEIVRTWGEYLEGAFDRINDQNARKLVLYLTAHDPEERSRKEIREDLTLDMTDNDLKERLHQLVMADILAKGSSDFHYRGLDDRVFRMVFRRIYGVEIDHMSVAEIDDDFNRELAALKGKLSAQKGANAEHRVRYRLLVASLRGAILDDLITRYPHGTDADDVGATEVGPFRVIRKARFYLDQEHSVEIDLHAVHRDDDGTDLMIEIKDWQKEPTRSAVRRFVEVKATLGGQLEGKTLFLFYSESGLSAEAAEILTKAGIFVLDAEKLACFETFP